MSATSNESPAAQAVVVASTRSSAPEFTPALMAAIEKAVADGIKPATAAQLVGVPSRTWELWCAVAEGRITHYSDGSAVSDTQRRFLAPLAEAIERGRAQLEARLTKTLMDAGDRELMSGGLDWRAHEAILKRHPLLKRDWGEYREQRVETGGRVNHYHRLVQSLPATQVLELASPDIAALVDPE